MSIEKYLPSKRYIAFVLVPILTFLIFYFGYTYIKNNYFKELNTKQELKLTKLKKNLKNSQTDTDGDGLKDWEEDLLGTDKYKKDTDGDGIFDGQEVLNKTDPNDPNNKENIQDTIDKLNEKRIQYYYLFNPNLSATDKLTIQLVNDGLKLGANGMSKNKDAQNQIVDKTIRNVSYTINFNPKKFSLKDLKIVKNYDLLTFKENFADILQELKDKKLIDEVLLINKYLDRRKEKDKSELERNLKVYKEIESKLLSLKIPKELENEYLNFINIYDLETQILSNQIKGLDNDPMLLTQSLAVNKSADKAYFESIKKIAEKINKLTQ